MRYLLAIMLIILVCLLSSKSTGTVASFTSLKSAFRDNGKVKEITDKDVMSNDWEKHKYTIVDMYATWCGPCSEFHPKFVDASKKYNNVFFATIDIDTNSNYRNSFNVLSIPTVILFKDGVIVRKFTNQEVFGDFDSAVSAAIKGK